MSAQKKSLGRRVVFAFIPLVAIVVAVEIGTRIFAWTLMRSDIVGGRASTRASPLVACYGDSWTFGLGVSRDSAYPAALARALAKAGLPDVRVTNRGIPGARLRRVKREISRDLASDDPPDVLIVLVGINDIPNFKRFVGTDRPASPGAKAVYENSATYRLMRALVVPMRRRFVPKLDKRASALESDVFEERLNELARIVHGAGAKIIFPSYPLPVAHTRPQLLAKGDLMLETVALYRAAKSAGAAFVNMQDAIDRVPGDEPFLPIYLTHPGDLGYALMASALVGPVAEALGRPVGGAVDSEEIIGHTPPEEAQWPTKALFSERVVDYVERVEPDGRRVVEADCDGDGLDDYRAVFTKPDRMILERTDRSSDPENVAVREYEGTRLLRAYDIHAAGSTREVLLDQTTPDRLVTIYREDKNGDGIIDHETVMLNDRMASLRDDNDQDGNWELWGLIDDEGNDYMHVGDHDRDGFVDYWEWRDNEIVIFRSADRDRDGLPDARLPPAASLGRKSIPPRVVDLWSRQAPLPADEARP
ncbi:SGNH/GDSL hydrolase family protein [bacterium]|nr:SGNH/GDSL hydrolase family protein [bacterium]